VASGRGPHGRAQGAFRALLRESRRAAGLRQRDLATRLGVPQSYVSKVETGERRLAVLEVRRLCRALGVPFPAFAGRLEEVLASADGVDRSNAGI